MATKRKASTKAKTVGSKKQRTAITSEDVGSFRLLDLPPELRNHSYALVVEHEPQAYLKSGSRGDLTCKSALARTNRQIREEITSFLHISATGLIAEVRDFNFGHVITFLNKLDDVDLKALPTMGTVNDLKRTMTVKLIVTRSLHEKEGHRHLERWISRLETPEKKGATAAISYLWDEKRSSFKGSRIVMAECVTFCPPRSRKGPAYQAIAAACRPPIVVG